MSHPIRPVSAALAMSLLFGCAGAPGAQVGGSAAVALSALTLTELDGNGDDAPNRGETLYVKPVFTNTGSGPSGEFKVKFTVSGPADTHQRGIGTDQLTVASIAPGATSAGQSNFVLGLKIDKAAQGGAAVPLTLTATFGGGRVQTFEHTVTVAAIDNAFSLAGTAIAEASGLGDGKPGPGEVIYLKPRFTNTGAAKTNPLTVIVTAAGDAVPYVGADASSFISLGALNPGATSDAPTRAYLGVKIASGAKPGTSIPLTFTLKDAFGNQWEVADTLVLPAP